MGIQMLPVHHLNIICLIMSKLNLVIDFNNIAMRALFSCQYSGGDQPVANFDTDEECAVLLRKMATDVAYVMRLFNPSRTIFVCDSYHPWRETLYSDIDNEGYKGTRHKDENKNWDKIWAAWNEFKTILKNKGFVVIEIASAEADDLAALWKEMIISNNESVVLVSSDRDWTQLVDFKNNNCCLCFNPIANNKAKKKLYLTKECNDWLFSDLKTIDIFFTNYNSLKDDLAKLLTKDTKIEFEIINPEYVALNKVMCGDDGDNAPSIYEYYKNGKKVRMTELRSKKVFESLNISNIHDLCESSASGELKTAIEKLFKITLDNIDMDARVMRQRKLVELNSMLFPQEIVQTFNCVVDDNRNAGFVSVGNIKMEDILKDTKYLTKDFRKPKVNSIFDNLQDLDKFIKPLNSGLF